MKSDFHYHFYSRIAIMAVLAFVLLFMQRSVETTALESDFTIQGWAWSEISGWVSLNCYNDFDTPGQYENHCPPDYGLSAVNVGPDNDTYIQGCAWAGNPLNQGGDPLGWICFSQSGVTQAPVNGIATSTAHINALDSNQFASIWSFENYGGEAWKLGFPVSDPVPISDPDYPQSSNPLEGCFNCYLEYDYWCNINHAACDPVDLPCLPTGDPPVAQSCVVHEVYQNCDNCLEYFYYLGKCSETGSYCHNDQECDGGIDFCANISTCSDNIEQECIDNSECADLCIEREVGTLKKVIGGYECSQCQIENFDNDCGINSYQDNINSCESCTELYYTPGLMLDHEHYGLDPGESANLCGWAWNSWLQNGTTYGLGWFQFGPRVVNVAHPYISVEGGSIYAKGDITGRYVPPFGKYNASYIIESGGSITNFISEKTLSSVYQGELPYRPEIQFFSYIADWGKYSNALGTVDLVGITSQVGTTQYNKYDSQIVELDPADFSNIFISPLNGQTFIVNGDLTIDTGSLLVLPGVGAGRGSGVIIVEGNLTINNDIIYDSLGGYSNLKQIPSLVWVIQGDVSIDSAVSELAGTFIVLGDGTDPNFCSDDPPAGGCGQFITCNGTEAECKLNPLLVTGSVMARNFQLLREYWNPTTKEPSEQFFTDGRLQANPPPGFTDFSKLIPRFTENPH